MGAGPLTIRPPGGGLPPVHDPPAAQPTAEVSTPLGRSGPVCQVLGQPPAVVHDQGE